MNNQISFISSFKKFKPPYGMIQHSALYSWLANDIKVIGCDNEVGLQEQCSAYSNITLFQGIKRARELGFPHQAPVMGDLINRALPLVETPMVALISPDIILPGNFSSIIDGIFRRYGFNIFLISARQDIQLNFQVNSPEAYQAVQREATKVSHGTSPYVFITSKFWWRKIISDMPEFIMGRSGWDNWLRMYVESNIKERYEASNALKFLHCSHGYGHINVQEKVELQNSTSSQHNLKLWGEAKKFDVVDTWKKI